MAARWGSSVDPWPSPGERPGNGERRVIYRLGEFSIDDERLELRAGSEPLEVQPKVLDLLLHLVRARDRVVSRRELLDELWGDATVTEGVLTTAVHEARAVLGDSAERQWAIKTIARRGYRLVAPVQELPDDAAPGSRSGGSDGWTDEAFVGRSDVLARLEATLEAAAGGRGRVAVVTGGPGIGKTRLIEELAARAEPRGFRTLAGWCYEGEGSPPYWPWGQVLRGAIPEERPEDALLDMGAGAADLAALVPSLHELRPDLPEPPRLQSGPARFRLFESITTFLANAAKRRPILVLLDDLQAADHASLRLLAFLARELRRTRVLVVVTVREGESDGDAVLVETLAELTRQSPGERTQLEGLSPDETAALIEGLTGLDRSRGLVRAIADRSEGNPFFVKEIVGLLHAQGRLEEELDAEAWIPLVPPGVRDVLLHRLQRRSPTCQRVLAVAAILGPEFRRDLLGRVSHLGREELKAGLEEACAAGFVRESESLPDHYRFSHGLMREAFYAEWGAQDRAQWHRRTGEALERFGAESAGAPPAALAHHFLKGVTGGGAEKALQYAVRAAEEALAVHAHDEAVRHYNRALEALELLQTPDDALRCELLIGLGTAQLNAHRYDPKGRESLLHAARIARQLGKSDHLARAAVELAAQAHQGGPGDPVVIELLEQALAGLDPGNEALKARVMADLAIQRLSAPDLGEGAQLSEEAVALARKAGDPTVLGETLNLRCILLSGPDHVRERLRQADSLLELAAETRSGDVALFGHRWRAVSLLELGEVEAADVELAEYERVAGEARAWTARWYVSTLRSTRALMEGRLEESEHLTIDAFSQRRHEPTPLAVYTLGSQLLWLRREQGRLEELAPYAKALESDSRIPMMVAFRATTALLDAERGSEEAARGQLAEAAASRLAELPRDFTYLYSLCVLGELGAAIGDASGAELLYEALAPYAGRHAVLFVGTVCLGSVSRYLGLTASQMGEWARAEAHFAEAVERNQRVGARLWLARTQYDWARMLHARGGRDAPERARELLRACLATSTELGLTALGERARALAPQVL